MALTPGSRLGPYEILGPVGAGAMGEVYRARDTRIGREIAIKILPAEVETDPERRRRFREESVAAGSLNHANVLTVHDVGHEAGRPYLVTELLHGSTLRDVLQRGPLTEEVAVRTTAALLDGLAAAHAQGIAHRDLKPENIFITDEGTPKILDFGIAKLPAGWRWSEGTAETTAATGSEMLLGTIGYMAPEQVTGGAVDHRADLFSMAVVLCEMLAGTAPFARPTAIETLNAIVTAEPVLPASASASLQSIVQHGLEKVPGRRFQSATDFAFALRQARPAHVAVHRTGVPWGSALVFVVVFLAMAAAAALLWPRHRGDQATAPIQQRRVTFQQGKVWSARFMPGGDTIIYTASWDGHPNTTFTARAEFPAPIDLGLPPSDIVGVSASGELALLLGKRSLQGTELSAGTLARSAVAGSAPRELEERVTAADWMPDGSTLAAVRDLGRVRRLEFPMGHPVYETAGWIGTIRVSRDGTRVAFTDHPFRTDDVGAFVVSDRAGKLTRLTHGDVSAHGLAWGPDDRELWVSIGTGIVAVQPDGTQRPLLDDPRGFTLLDVAADGRMLVVSDDRRVGLRALLSGDTEERDLTWFDYSVATDLAPNGRSVLFFESSDFAPSEYLIGLRRAGDAAPLRIGEGHSSSLSPDGKWVLATLLKKPSGVLVLPTGAGESRTITVTGLFDVHWSTWLPDGRRILVSAHEPGHGARLYLLDGTGQVLRPVGPEGTMYVWNGVSPDGMSVAALDPDHKLAIYPLAGGEGFAIPGGLEGERPAGWTADGSALFVQSPGIPAAISRVDVKTGDRIPFRQLIPPDATGVVRISPVLVSPDGRAYAYSYGRFLSRLYVLQPR